MLVVTSALSGEGKSVVSTNLAFGLAQRAGRVLLVDADLRRSSIETQLGLPKSKVGLSTVLATGSWADAIQTPFPEMPNLFVLPAGPRPPAPAEMLASDKMKTAMNAWANEYDYVVFDTAPIIPVADTLALAAAADAVVLVVRSGVSRKTALLRVRDLLRRANVNIAGVVLNCVDLSLEHYYSYPTRYGYSYRSYRSAYRDYYLDREETK